MPVVAQIAPDYEDEVAFLAVAGRSDPAAAEVRAEQLFGDALLWGVGDDVWELYGVRGQPVTVLLAGNDVIVDSWFGALPAEEIEQRLNDLIAVSG